MSESGSKFHFILPVWGSSYVEVYLNVVLATQLSDGNLGAVPLEGARYKIYTTAADERTIRQSPAFQALARRITVDFVAIDDLLRDAEWARTNDSQVQYFAPMNTIHRMAITDAARDPAVCLVFLMPDLILADGTLRFVAEAARQGKRAVMVYTLRADLDACRAALVRETSIESGSKRTVPPRLLVDLMLRYPHPMVAGLWWKGSIRQIIPIQMLFPAGKNGLISRGMHFHPLMVRPDGSKRLPRRTIDDDYLPLLGIGRAHVAVATDSDQAIGCEMTLADQHRGYLEQAVKWTVRRQGHFYAAMATGYFLLCLSYTVYLHSGDPSPERERVEAEAEAVVAEIRKWMCIYWLLPFPGYFRLWLAIKTPIHRRWGQSAWYQQLKRAKASFARKWLE